MLLSIIIVNYNVRFFLEQCLHSVKNAIADVKAEVIVVDNNSTDNSLDYLQPKFNWVIFIKNTTNMGFGKANNQALHLAKGEYILFLNPDTLIPENCLAACIGFMQHNKLAGALGIKMLDGGGRFLLESKRAFPSPLTSLFKLMGLSSLFPKSKIFARYHLGHLSKNESHEVDVLAGAFMLMPKKVLDKIGGFDEQFFMYGEDVDLSYRVQVAGWKNYYFAGSSIIHFKGESTKRGSLNYVRMFYSAMRVFVKKHYGGSQAAAFRVFVYSAIFLRAVMSVVKKGLLWVYVFIKKRVGISPKKIIENTLVIGTENAFNQLKKILKTSGNNEALSATMILLEVDKKNIANLKTQVALLKNKAETSFIFCIGSGLRMEQVLDLLTPCKKVTYQFYYQGSQSIVGSHSKETNGVTIANNGL